MNKTHQTISLLSQEDIQNAFINALSLFFNQNSQHAEQGKESIRLSHKEAAKMLGVSTGTLTKWRHLNLVPFYQLKKRGTVFYDLEELKAKFKQNSKLTKYTKK